MVERVWRNRLRWRVRGAWLWPTFAAGLVVDALLLELLPIAGDDGPGLFAALLLAGVLQLVVVAAGTQLAGRLVRRARPTLPKIVADDRAGTALLVALGVTFLTLGLSHRGAIDAERTAFAVQADAARAFVLANAPPEFRDHVDRMDTWKLRRDHYRTCAPGADRRHAFCVYVFTDQDPARLVADPDRTPNATLAGPDSPGRRSR